MSQRLLLIVSIALTASAFTLTATAASPPERSAPKDFAATDSNDPHLWLEEIDGERALQWVAQQNQRTREELASSPRFRELEREVLAALNSTSRVPTLRYHGPRLYNLWRDPEHPRGLFRRTTIEELRQPTPRWTSVLDIDELSRREGKPWVFKSMESLPPIHRRCLVALSPGGGDAVEVREFDAESLRFVEEGFGLPVAKSIVNWIDENTVFVGTDFGPGSLTSSGYPRVAKIWKRGTPLTSAKTIHEGSSESVNVQAQRFRTATGDIDLVQERKTFWTEDRWHWSEGKLHRLIIPETAEIVDGFRGQLVIHLQEDWKRAGTLLKAGSVLVADPVALRKEGAAVTVLVEPTSSQVVEHMAVADHQILVSMLDNVRGRLVRFVPSHGEYQRRQIALPDHGAVSLMSIHAEAGDALVLFQSFTVPPTLYFVSGGSTEPEKIISQQPTFDGTGYETVQEWAVSKDGTRIPYFISGPRGLKRDGSNPVHIFSYGGFRNALTPSYSGSYEALYGAYGKAWLARGGVFVLANIRGGGEFGPAWHTSVLKANRHKVFEDFEAVAEHLVASGVTKPARIGIEGRSNGGLLTLATMIRRPELYGAVISGVPLSDMRRYHQLLAGASWMAEFGDPRIPEDWNVIASYSPYQNFRAGVKYPPVFIYTSTRDDRVHPGHARKTVARLQELGHDVWYYENTEGGHGGSSTNEQLAYRVALSYAHLWRQLGK